MSIEMTCQRCGKGFPPVIEWEGEIEGYPSVVVGCPFCKTAHVMERRTWDAGRFPKRQYPSTPVGGGKDTPTGMN